MNDDGYDDLVVQIEPETCVWCSRIAMLPGPFGPGGLESFQPMAELELVWPRVRGDFACADFDGDGRDDLVTTFHGEDPSDGAGVHFFSQPMGGFSGDLDPSSAVRIEVPTLDDPAVSTQYVDLSLAGDLNGDAVQDLLVRDRIGVVPDLVDSVHPDSGTHRWRLTFEQGPTLEPVSQAEDWRFEILQLRQARSIAGLRSRVPNVTAVRIRGSRQGAPPR